MYNLYNKIFSFKNNKEKVVFKRKEEGQEIYTADRDLIDLLIEKTQAGKIDWKVPKNQDEKDSIWTVSLNNTDIVFTRKIRTDSGTLIKTVAYYLDLKYVSTVIISEKYNQDSTNKELRNVNRGYIGNRSSILGELYKAINELDNSSIIYQINKTNNYLENL